MPPIPPLFKSHESSIQRKGGFLTSFKKDETKSSIVNKPISVCDGLSEADIFKKKQIARKIGQYVLQTSYTRFLQMDLLRYSPTTYNLLIAPIEWNSVHVRYYYLKVL